ncbi:hypothetical protein OB920_07965 [Halobacteria archaeon HArc-gm2]|nr:hypothetical protein [Halobacteria archaeon HArc-gm2]
MTDGRTRRVFVEMLREEWRMHSHLFRGGHFALFPVLIAALTAGAAWLLVTTGTGPGTVFAGLHALAFVFGLHTGSIGFVGRDALRNLLGDLTLLVFTARTLPLSQDRLLGIFVVKDLVYYAILFLLPMALGTGAAVAVASGGGGVAGGQGVAEGLPAAGTALGLWATLTLTFVLGMGATIAALGITRRGVPGWTLLAALGAAVGVAVAGNLDVAAYTPYGVFLDATLPRVGASLALVAAVFVVGALTFDASARPAARTVAPAFRRWRDRVGDPVATKTLLDVHRSSGGFGKVLFSAAVLLGVTASLIDLAGQITGVSPSVGVSFGAILGLSGFTTYNWLTQSDDVDSYLVHPLSVEDVFAAKFRAFLLLGPLVGLAFYAVALAWRGGPILEALVGAVLLVGVACYIFGTTVYLTGLSPNEFLFDTGLFAVFGLAMVLPLVPILVVGFALAPVSTGLLAALGAGGLVLALAGVGLYRRSLAKWPARYRER